MSFAALWESLLPLGRVEATGGYRRLPWTPEDAACRRWFTATARERDLRVEADRNGNLWAWWDAEKGAAVATGSHLDSVPDGGAFDGPLGVVSAFAAIDLLRGRRFAPARPIAVVAFTDEEGGRFGLPCLGSRLTTGEADPRTTRSLRDRDGITLAEAMAGAGQDPELIGPDPGRLSRLGVYVELHIEQGRALADLDAPVGVAELIWPHGRWRLDFAGCPDHAGTAGLVGRRDPMLPFAATVLATREAAARHGGRATISRVLTEPGAVNAVSATVRAWLDARAPDGVILADLVAEVLAAARSAAASHRVDVAAVQESFTAAVEFDARLRDRVVAALAARGIRAPLLATGAGHDAGVLAAVLPTAMLFVRNPTGISHAPAEHAELPDCQAGVEALATVLADLSGDADGLAERR